MTIGNLMLDLEGIQLSAEEQELLQHPQVGGVIFFARNYYSAEQITELVAQVRASTKRPLLLAVDHEGGRVQRFRSEFTTLPPIAQLGQSYNDDPLAARQAAQRLGWLMAAEIRAIDIDFSFAPVLDLDYGSSSVIGDRALHQDANAVTALAAAYIDGMHQAGMAATGKHFPGHGYITTDSHHAIARDSRHLAAIQADDMRPFKALSQTLQAVMPAHVIYEQVDSQPAVFSRIWLQDILREQLGFNGVIVSDDLSMAGASWAGGYPERALAALEAGCDLILACNNREGAITILDHDTLHSDPAAQKRLQAMQGQTFMNRSALLDNDYWQQAVHSATALT